MSFPKPSKETSTTVVKREVKRKTNEGEKERRKTKHVDGHENELVRESLELGSDLRSSELMLCEKKKKGEVSEMSWKERGRGKRNAPVTPLPMAAVEELQHKRTRRGQRELSERARERDQTHTPPVTVLRRLSTNSAPDHCGKEGRVEVSARTKTKTSDSGRKTHSLMSENVTSDIPLPPLDELDVSLHSLLSERGSEEVGDVGVGVKTSKLRETKREKTKRSAPSR